MKFSGVVEARRLDTFVGSTYSNYGASYRISVVVPGAFEGEYQDWLAALAKQLGTIFSQPPWRGGRKFRPYAVDITQITSVDYVTLDVAIPELSNYLDTTARRDGLVDYLAAQHLDHPDLRDLWDRAHEKLWHPGPFYAYRIWHLNTISPGFFSPAGEWMWAGGLNIANCFATDLSKSSVGNGLAPYGHRAPHWGCHCGFYGLKSRMNAYGRLPRPGTMQHTREDVMDMAAGIVELGGEIIEHEWGYRAEVAVPRMVFLEPTNYFSLTTTTPETIAAKLEERFPELTVEIARPIDGRDGESESYFVERTEAWLKSANPSDALRSYLQRHR